MAANSTDAVIRSLRSVLGLDGAGPSDAESLRGIHVRLVLDVITPRVEGELIDSTIEGRVVIEPGARLVRSAVRGPAIIGAGALIEDAYVGPYTAISENVVIRKAEVEHSIFLADSRIEDLEARVESSLVGRGVVIARSKGLPRAYRFMIGDSSEIGIL